MTYEWHIYGCAQTNELGLYLWRLCGDAVYEHPKIKATHVFDRTFLSQHNALEYLRAKAREFAFDEENLSDMLEEVERLGTLTWAGVQIGLKKVKI